jgi:hypothetical protein
MTYARLIPITCLSKAIYDGDNNRLRFHGCLIRPSTVPTKVLAQFDALHLTESHGWHEFDREDFANVVSLCGGG